MTLDTLPQLHRLDQGDGSLSAGLPAAAGTPTSAGLRFHILRSHARGGFGEVFVT
jgi:hypothetical protein